MKRINKAEIPQPTPRGLFSGKEFPVFPICLLGLLVILFRQSFLPDFVLFSNDGPLGVNNAKFLQSPSCFFGIWADLNWLGGNAGGTPPCITGGLGWLLGPLGFSKFYAALTLLFWGLCAWFFFRQLKLGPLACFLGGLAAALNSDFFSVSCWGVGPQALTFGLDFLALAAVVGNFPRWPWLRFILAGLAVGMGVMESADIGYIFSLFVAAFVIYHALTETGSFAKKAAKGVARLAAVTVFAVFIAAYSLTNLIGIQIKGIVGMAQDAETKARRWDQATQWSVPKREVLGSVVAGLFGYRMDTPGGGEYWGAIGRDAAWYRYFEGGQQGPPPPGFIRQNGGGGYAGVLVVLVAAWAGIQSLRRENSVFSPGNRKLIWFWLGTAAVSMLLAFGRYAPFYQFFYALPYSSTIRNPAKFGHVFNWALMVLFAYGMHGLSRRYLEIPAAKFAGLSGHLKNWWAKAALFDKRWTIGSAGAIGISLLGWLVYASSRHDLETYLQTVQFDAGTASAIAGFSLMQVGWFILFLALAVSMVTLVLSGAFAGARAKWAGILLGLLLVTDLVRADLNWIVHWNYKIKYATNPIIEFLREKSYEHRVTLLPEWILSAFRLPEQVTRTEARMNGLYDSEWKQQLFPYYNIQTLDIVQMPRTPEDLEAYERALAVQSAETLRNVGRRWELTNTRYVLGFAGFIDLLNGQFDPGNARFRVAERFDIVPKPGITEPTRWEEMTAEPLTNGIYALFEFTGALPRAKLYSNWQVSTNDQDILKELASPSFDPWQTVLVSTPAALTAAGATNQDPGTVEYASYAPKDIVLKAVAKTPAVLLLNDRYDPSWQVWVDGERKTLLRCNFIMRGVYLPEGQHTVTFRFRPPVGLLYVSLAAVALGLGLCVLLLLIKDRPAAKASSLAAKPPS